MYPPSGYYPQQPKYQLSSSVKIRCSEGVSSGEWTLGADGAKVSPV